MIQCIRNNAARASACETTQSLSHTPRREGVGQKDHTSVTWGRGPEPKSDVTSSKNISSIIALELIYKLY